MSNSHEARFHCLQQHAFDFVQSRSSEGQFRIDNLASSTASYIVHFLLKDPLVLYFTGRFFVGLPELLQLADGVAACFIQYFRVCQDDS